MRPAFGGDDPEALDEAEFGQAGERALDGPVVRALGPEQAAICGGEQEAGVVEAAEHELGATLRTPTAGVRRWPAAAGRLLSQRRRRE
jgi:hypothetical protein